MEDARTQSLTLPFLHHQPQHLLSSLLQLVVALGQNLVALLGLNLATSPHTPQEP